MDENVQAIREGGFLKKKGWFLREKVCVKSLVMTYSDASIQIR